MEHLNYTSECYSRACFPLFYFPNGFPFHNLILQTQPAMGISPVVEELWPLVLSVWILQMGIKWTTITRCFSEALSNATCTFHVHLSAMQ